MTPAEPTPLRLRNGFFVALDGSHEPTYGEYFRREDYDALRAQLTAANAEVERIKDALDFDPDDQHTIADMANVGRSLMEAIKDCAPKYCYNESPAEIVCDLINQRDEATARAEAAEKDAKRYRTLRALDEWEAFDTEWISRANIYGGSDADLDAAIDAMVKP